ncbi:MAG: type III pantothenate kinase [Candidatus Brocadiia bacterium]
MILAIDVGNSRVHFGCFNDSGKLVASEVMAHNDLRELISRRRFGVKDLSSFGATEPYRSANTTYKSAVNVAVMASTCPRMDKSVVKLVRRLFGIGVIKIGKDLSVPIANRTINSSMVGQDRLLNALAAYRRTKTQTLVIDVGTAITIDVVSKKGEFVGGVIAPGLNVMAQALYQNCEKLPLIRMDKIVSVIGNNTESAMASGVFFSVVGLINEVVKRISSRLKSKPKIIITGGDAVILNPYLADKCIFVPNLTLEGIYLVSAGL